MNNIKIETERLLAGRLTSGPLQVAYTRISGTSKVKLLVGLPSKLKFNCGLRRDWLSVTAAAAGQAYDVSDARWWLMSADVQYQSMLCIVPALVAQTDVRPTGRRDEWLTTYDQHSLAH